MNLKLLKLNDIKQLVKAYSGNENPSIWILDENVDQNLTEHRAINPTCAFIDDDGDIIIQVDKDLL